MSLAGLIIFRKNYLCVKIEFMKVLLEIKDSKAEFVLELLNSLFFVKAKPVNETKQQILDDLKEAVHNVNLAKQGKIKLKSARQLFDEL